MLHSSIPCLFDLNIVNRSSLEDHCRLTTRRFFNSKLPQPISNRNYRKQSTAPISKGGQAIKGLFKNGLSEEGRLGFFGQYKCRQNRKQLQATPIETADIFFDRSQRFYVKYMDLAFTVDQVQRICYSC